MAALLLVAFAAQACGSAMLPRKRATKNAHSVLREDERANSSDMPLRLHHWSPGNPHAAFRGTTSNTPGRCRSGALISPTGPSNSRAESGHRYNGLSRTDLLARIRGLSSVVVLAGRPSAYRRWRDFQPRETSHAIPLSMRRCLRVLLPTERPASA